MNKRTQFLFSLLALFTLAGAIALTLYLTSPPQPLPVDSPASMFSAGLPIK